MDMFAGVRSHSHIVESQVESPLWLFAGRCQRTASNHIKDVIGHVIGVWRMAMNKLSAVWVEKVKAPGIYADGGGLRLQVTAGKRGIGEVLDIALFALREGSGDGAWRLSCCDVG